MGNRRKAPPSVSLGQLIEFRIGGAQGPFYGIVTSLDLPGMFSIEIWWIPDQLGLTTFGAISPDEIRRVIA